MKRLLSIFFMLCLMLIGATAASAQSAQPKERISREQLAEKQILYIISDLKLDEKTAQRVRAIWMDYQTQVWALGPRVPRKKQHTDAEAEQNLKQRMERSKQILALREKYYGLYSEVLTAKQIERMYELEYQMIHRLTKHKRR